MANGTGLLGHTSASEAALIVKQPGNANIYFVFTLDADAGSNGLRYSIVDMNLAAGMGSVTVKNTLLHAPCAEKLCGVVHCNGTDVWVISHDFQSIDFRAYLVTASGVSTNPVISSVGSYIASAVAGAGCMKISPNGKKLGQALRTLPSIELYDFDAATGTVSNPLILPLSIPPGSAAYGVEFSPDGTKFYGTTTSSGLSQLHQWDLCSGNSAAIIASHQSFTATVTNALQLGPDGKIYTARGRVVSTLTSAIIMSESMLGVINNPNASGAAINFINAGQSVAPKSSLYGLPNFVTGFYKTPVVQYTYTVNPPVSCTTASFTAPPLSSSGCAVTSFTASSLMWIFGDPGSGANNVSTLLNPVHVYSGPGAYHAKLVLYNSCGGVIDTLKQDVQIGNIPLNNTTSGFSVCRGQSLVLNGTGSLSYTWSTGATTNSISITPTVNTTYTVNGIDAHGCLLRSVQTVSVHESPTISVTGSPNLCIGRTATQVAVGASSYTWSNGAISSSLVVTPAVATIYTVTGTAPGGCTASIATTVNILPLPSLTVTGTHTVCAWSAFTLEASGASVYGWSDGSHSATLSLVPHPSLQTHTYYVTGVSAIGCFTRQTVSVTVMPLPTVSIAGNTQTVCAGSVLTKTALGASGYTWSTGDKSNVANLLPLSNTIYTVTGANNFGCTNTATTLITVKPTPTVTTQDVQACSGDTFTLSVTSVSAQGVSYTWYPDQVRGYSITSVAGSAAIYTVTASNSACTASATSSLSIISSTTLSISPDVQIISGTSTQLHVSGGGSYTWSPTDHLDCTNCPNPVASPETDTRYCVISQSGTCPGTACVNVSIACDSAHDLSVPNAFTPNGDKNNDEFCLQGWKECVRSFEIMIFNRWGERIYESADAGFCWDGVYKGQLLNPDIFVYVISAMKYSSDTVIHKKGNITLIR